MLHTVQAPIPFF
uniref:Uncharacterized protein n=1 Tax=Anguilla anguilla TaxID=7936 RepID=A0A0E9P7E6_ANGAN